LKEFDTDKEERHGAWVVLAMYAVAATVPLLACVWIRRQLEYTALVSRTGIGPFLGGLTIAGLAAYALGVVGIVLVIYGLVRVRMHGLLYVVVGLLATATAISPILVGWNAIDETPLVEDFDPGDCSICGDDGGCVRPWPVLGSKIPALGECRGGRREGEWVFGRRNERRMASFTFESGLRHGPFETDSIHGSFRDDLRDGEWVWFRSGQIVARGRYVGGEPDGRWACLDEDTGDEVAWALFDRGRFIKGTAETSDAEAQGIYCDPLDGSPPIDPFELMVLAKPRAKPEN